jgi:protoporphyrinogen IX oxidase
VFDLSLEALLWIKALHVIGVISWMAGLLYLPRLFVYHTKTQKGSEASETFKIMEGRLLKAIMHPAMVASFLFGGVLALEGGEIDAGAWFHAKMACVAALLAFHVFLGRWCRAFARDDNRHNETFFRALNEIPTVLMIAIVVMVVVKPF